MARRAYVLIAFVTLSAWAGAQGPSPAQTLSAEDRLRLLKTNGTLINNLVESGIELSNAENTEARVVKCRDAARLLAQAIQEAAQKQEAERVAELTGLFREVVQEGFLPTYARAVQEVPAESPAARKLREQRVLAAGDVNGLKDAIPTSGKMGENARVREALRQLAELAEQLK